MGPGFSEGISPVMDVIPCEAFARDQPDAHAVFQPTMTPASGISVFQPDWMHTKCLGTDSHLLGSCLAYVIKEVLPGTLDENVALVWNDVRHYYATHRVKCRLGNLTWNMIKNDPFPKLSAKAVETKCLLPAVRDFLQNWVEDPVVAWMHHLLVLSCEMDKIVFGNKTFVLSPQEAENLCELIFEYNGVLTTLARNLHSRGLAYCNYTPQKPLSLSHRVACSKDLHQPKASILL